jgi:hypothetical protein
MLPLSASPDNDNNNEDLFDYFDPLLSPHAYPDGIAPDKKPQSETASPSSTANRSTKKNVMGFTLPNKGAKESSQSSRSSFKASDSNHGEDLFDYFDPLLSPHAYPKGVSPSHKPTDLKNDNHKAIETKTVGILLMDHGSRKEASNARLQAMAQLYQSSMDEQYNSAATSQSTKVIVKAAHMEIATPSIPDGLQALLQEGVDEIVCHPFFLSPDGRHVKEDIPEIINEAIASLNIQVPVVTTAPVGSNVNLMLSVVHSLVVEKSEVLEH